MDDKPQARRATAAYVPFLFGFIFAAFVILFFAPAVNRLVRVEQIVSMLIPKEWLSSDNLPLYWMAKTIFVLLVCTVLLLVKRTINWLLDKWDVRKTAQRAAWNALQASGKE